MKPMEALHELTEPEQHIGEDIAAFGTIISVHEPNLTLKEVITTPDNIKLIRCTMEVELIVPLDHVLHMEYIHLQRIAPPLDPTICKFPEIKLGDLYFNVLTPNK